MAAAADQGGVQRATGTTVPAFKIASLSACVYKLSLTQVGHHLLPGAATEADCPGTRARVTGSGGINASVPGIAALDHGDRLPGGSFTTFSTLSCGPIQPSEVDSNRPHRECQEDYRPAACKPLLAESSYRLRAWFFGYGKLTNAADAGRQFGAA